MINPINQRLEGIKQISETIDASTDLNFILKCADGAIIGYKTKYTDAESIETYKHLVLEHLHIVTIGYKGDARLVLNFVHQFYLEWQSRFEIAPSGLTVIKSLSDRIHQQLSKSNAMPLAVKVLLYDSKKHRLDKLLVDTSHQTDPLVIAAGQKHFSFTNKLASQEFGICSNNPLEENLKKLYAAELITPEFTITKVNKNNA